MKGDRKILTTYVEPSSLSSEKLLKILQERLAPSSDDFTLEILHRTAPGASTHTREQTERAGRSQHFTAFQGSTGTRTNLSEEGLCHPQQPSFPFSQQGSPPKFNDSINAESAQTVLRECSHRTKITPGFSFTEGGALFSYPRDFPWLTTTLRSAAIWQPTSPSPPSHTDTDPCVHPGHMLTTRLPCRFVFFYEKCLKVSNPVTPPHFRPALTEWVEELSYS